MQLPTTSGMESCSALKPSTNWQGPAVPWGTVGGTLDGSAACAGAVPLNSAAAATMAAYLESESLEAIQCLAWRAERRKVARSTATYTASGRRRTQTK